MTSLMGSRPYTPTGSLKEKTPSGYSRGAINNLSPDQQQLWQRLFQGSQGGVDQGVQNLSRLAGGDEEMFNQLEAPALRQFSQLQGGIASRFSGMGTGGRKSSGFQNTISGAGTDLAERLQGQRMSLQQNATDQLMRLSQQLLGTQMQDKFLYEKKKPAWEKYMGAALPIAGAVGGAALGSVVPGIGTLAGAKLGGSIGTAAGGAFF